MKILDVLQIFEQFAPLALQADFDNAGLQVGNPNNEITAALLTLDVTEAVVDEALTHGANLIVSHHPLIFHPLRHISPQTYIERVVARALQHDITIVSMHTNVDETTLGVNHKIGEKLALHDMRFFGQTTTVNGVAAGQGVIGTLGDAVPAHTFVALIKERFHVACLQTNQPITRPIITVAICGGAGAFLLPDAIHAGADAFITGEMRYNEFFDHDDEIFITVLGHYQSEQYTPEIFYSLLTQQGIVCHLSQVNTNPIHYF